MSLSLSHIFQEVQASSKKYCFIISLGSAQDRKCPRVGRGTQVLVVVMVNRTRKVKSEQIFGLC